MNASGSAVDRRWDAAACAVLLLALWLEAVTWPEKPRFLDWQYHLAAASGFLRAGGYCLTAFWEFAPWGRPHLYPPFLQIILAAFLKAGVSAAAAARVCESAVALFWLATIWRVARSAYSPRAGFFAAALAFSSYPLYSTCSTQPAATLATAFGLLAFHSARQKKNAACALWTALALYTHGFAAWAFAAAIVAWPPAARVRLKSWIPVAGAFALASPLLFHLWRHRTYFAPSAPPVNALLEIDPLLWAAALGGFVVGWRRGGAARFPLVLWGCFLPVVFAYPPRFWGAQGLLPVVLAAALALDALAGRFISSFPRNWIAAIGAFAFFQLASPAFVADLGSKTSAWGVVNGTLPRFLSAQEIEVRTMVFEREYAKILRAVQAAPPGILWSNLPYVGAYLSAETGRATSNAALREVAPYRQPDALGVSTVQVWMKGAERELPPEFGRLSKEYGLQKSAETDLAVVSVRASLEREKPAMPALPLTAAFVLAASAVCAASILTFRKERPVTPRRTTA